MLASYAYDDRGRRTSLTRGNGTVTSYAHDNVSRLTSLAQDLATSGADVTFAMTYNPASQIATRSGAHGGYAWQGHYAVNRNYTANGLNQYTAAGGVTPTYDGRGNLTSAGSITYGYDSANMLVSATGSVQLGYDPLRRLAWTTGNPNFTHFAYDNEALIAEYDYSGNLVRRYVHGPGTDEPLVWYEGTGTSDRRWLHADERGSIVAASNASGAPIGYNSYDEYGIPASGNIGRFQYTGQQWIAELGMYHYRARIYSPTLGRFLQTDPIGFAGGMNLYAYVGGDPVNSVDPSGTVDIFMTGTRIARLDVGAGLCGSCSGFSANVGMRNMAAERRRNDSIPWTATGHVTTYSDGTQSFSGSVRFGGRLGGTTFSLGTAQLATLLSISQPTGFVNPYVQINLPTPALIAKIERDHGGTRAGRSVFYEQFRTQGGVLSLASYAAMNFIPQPASSVGGSTRMAYDASFSRPVGWDRSGRMTYNYVVIIQWTGLRNREGVRIFNVVTMFPGLRGE